MSPPKSDPARCERAWKMLTSVGADGLSLARGQNSDRFSSEEIDSWLDASPEDQRFDLANLDEADRNWLRERGFDLTSLECISDDPPNTSGEAFRREVSRSASSRYTNLERHTGFQLDVVRNRCFEQICPLAAKSITSNVGFWLQENLLVYLFKSTSPFFVFLSTISTRKTLFYFPEYSLQFIVNPHETRDTNVLVKILKKYYLNNYEYVGKIAEIGQKKLAYHVGFSGNIAHNLRDDLGGLAKIVDHGLLDQIDKFIVGPNMFYGDLTEIFPEISSKKIVKLDSKDDIVNIQRIYIEGEYFPTKVCGTFIKIQFANQIIGAAFNNINKSTFSYIQKFAAERFPLIAFTVRVGSREWVGQEHGLVEIAKSMAKRFPNLAVVIDGLNDLAPRHAIEEEKRRIGQIVEKLQSCGIPVVDTIGASICESVAWAMAVDAYVAPHGAGLAKYHLLAGKPGVVHGNTQIIGDVRGRWFDGTDVEDANMPIYVSLRSITTLAGTGEQFRRGPLDRRNDLDQYQCDWRSIDVLLRRLVGRLDGKDREVALGDRRPARQSRGYTRAIYPGHTPAVSFKNDPRCSYGFYASRKAIKSGPHDGVPLIVFVHGRVQSGPPQKLTRLADQLGAIVFHPYFPAYLENDVDEYGYCYFSDDTRYDLILLKMLEDFSDCYGIHSQKFYICGGSAGAQFVNRFMLLHPRLIAGASLLAPGSITRPSSDAPWWVGLGDFRDKFERDPDLAALNALPVQIVVGADDTSPTAGLSARYWMDEAVEIGANRIERASNLANDLRGLGAQVEFVQLPGVAHDIHRMWDHAMQFLETCIASEHQQS